jgi:hypothetical protein
MISRDQQASFLLGPALGFTIWAIGFVGLYAMQAVGCAYSWDEIALSGGVSLQRAQLVGILCCLLAGLLFLALRWRGAGTTVPPVRSFLRSVSVAGLFAALFASAFTFGPAIALSACNGLR